MKKLILSTLLVASVLLSCKKSDADSPTPNTPGPNVPTPNQPAASCTPVQTTAIQNGFSSYTFFYLYNTAKIGKLQNYDGVGKENGYTQYSYVDNRIIEADYYQNGDPNGGGKVYHLDEKGRIKLAAYYEIFTSSEDTIFFQYDANGNNTYRIHKRVGTETTVDTISYSYVNNVRVKSEKIKNGNLLESHVYEYTSNPDLVGYNELLHIDIGQASIPGKGLFGNMGPNLISKITFKGYNSPNSDYVATSVYEFDSNGYPIKATYDVKSGPGNASFTDVTTYTYECR